MARDHGQTGSTHAFQHGRRWRMFAEGFPIAAAITKHRKYVAMKLLQAARKGDTRLDALEDVARRALHDLSAPELQKDQVNGHGHWPEPSSNSADLALACFQRDLLGEHGVSDRQSADGLSR